MADGSDKTGLIAPNAITAHVRCVLLPAALLKALLPLMSKDETRLNLNGLHIAVDDNGLTLQATDGHCGARIRLPLTGHAGLACSGLDVIVPRTALVTALKAAGKEESMGIMVAGKMVRLDANGTSTTAAAVDSQFPDFRQVIPKGRMEGGKPVCLNLSILAKFQSLAELGPRGHDDGQSNAGTIIEMGEAELPVRLTWVGKPEWIGVAMPMRA